MNRKEAYSLASNRDREASAGKARHENPDDRPAWKQLETKERANFEGRIAQAAKDYDTKTGEWPAEEWFRRHRNRFYARLDAENSYDKYTNPPCKNWEARLGPRLDADVLSALRSCWDGSVRQWAQQHPYLASPSAPCECVVCSPNLPRQRYNDPVEWPALVSPFGDEI